MTSITRLIVPDEASGQRIDVFCARTISGYSRSHFIKLATAEHIRVEGKAVKPSYRVKAGQRVEIDMVSAPPIEAAPENIPLNLVYEDEHLAVIDKPAGMVCHPAAGNYSGTLVNALLFHFAGMGEFGDKIRPGIVHRLDKGTSGLMVVAKDEPTMIALQRKIKERAIKRTYTAIVWGKLPQASGVIDLPLGRSPHDRKKMRVHGLGERQARTIYEVKKTYSVAEMLSLKLDTGRTHQIRVHLSHLGHPVVGDPTYGGRAAAIVRLNRSQKLLGLEILKAINRQALHSSKLEFEHPQDGRQLSFQSNLPEDMQKVVAILEKEAV